MVLMFITNDVGIARHVVGAGVDRLFVDLEVLGKDERQGHVDTHRARHRVEDVAALREALPGVDILARVNPPHEDTRREVDAVIEAGADMVMLPMFVRPEEVEAFAEAVGGRARTTLLLETPQALARLDAVLEHRERIDEIHVGLNDLHLGLGLDFLFEPLSGGLLDHVVARMRGAGIRFGFGGVARVGEGAIPAELILGEHVRLGSEMVILSRAFHLGARTAAELAERVDVAAEIAKLRACVSRWREAGEEELASNRSVLKEAVAGVVREVRSRREGVAA